MRITDIHTHGIGAYDIRSISVSALRGMAKEHGRAGTGAIVPTIYSGTIGEMRQALEAVARAMSEKQQKCQILGAHLEGPFLNPAKSGAQNTESCIRPTLKNLKELINGHINIISSITIAPELPGALRAIEYATSLGIRISMGHSEATYAQAQEGKRAGATCVTHIFNAMAGIHHREPGLAGFALMDDDLYIELIADGVHVSKEMIRMIFRIKNPERIILVSDTISGPQKINGQLQGGKIPLSKAAEKLIKLKIAPRKLIQRTIRQNPVEFLRGQ